jgi:hypothetical protein
VRRARPRPRRERELAPAVSAHLESEGYRVWVDPDGTDYFDVIARRGPTLGLVELKLDDGRTVLRQALRRRGWADWVAVAVPDERLARRIAERPVAGRGLRVGVWWIESGRVHVLRPARPIVAPGEPDPFPGLKAQLHERLDLVESGALPLGVAWNLLPAARRDLPGRRSTRDWRLEEFTEGPDRPDPAPGATARSSARSDPPSGRS